MIVLCLRFLRYKCLSYSSDDIDVRGERFRWSIVRSLWVVCCFRQLIVSSGDQVEMTERTRVSVGVLLLICLPRARRCGMFCDDLDLDSTFGRQVADSKSWKYLSSNEQRADRPRGSTHTCTCAQSPDPYWGFSSHSPEQASIPHQQFRTSMTPRPLATQVIIISACLPPR